VLALLRPDPADNETLSGLGFVGTAFLDWLKNAPGSISAFVFVMTWLHSKQPTTMGTVVEALKMGIIFASFTFGLELVYYAIFEVTGNTTLSIAILLLLMAVLIGAVNGTNRKRDPGRLRQVVSDAGLAMLTTVLGAVVIGALVIGAGSFVILGAISVAILVIAIRINQPTPHGEKVHNDQPPNYPTNQ
jgi:hypothetical protein